MQAYKENEEPFIMFSDSQIFFLDRTFNKCNRIYLLDILQTILLLDMLLTYIIYGISAGKWHTFAMIFPQQKITSKTYHQQDVPTDFGVAESSKVTCLR